MGRSRLGVMVVALLATVAAVTGVDEAAAVNDGDLPPGFTDAAYSSGRLNFPTAMTILPGGRFLVSQQNGQLKIVEADGTVRADPLLTVPTEYFGTQGLFGAAVHPDWPSQRYVYVYFTARRGTAIVNRVSRFTVTADGNSTVSGSELVIYESENIKANATVNHIGGDLQFGLDRKLYVTTGDNLTGSNAQSLGTTLGKVLRFDADGSIPADNPYYGSTTGYRRAIWATGLRNPWKAAVDPVTGKFHVSDVGANSWEEINEIARGRNYQWPDVEGRPSPGAAGQGPVFTYGHSQGDPQGNTVAGGVFYRSRTGMFPAAYDGDFFFADFGRDWVGVLDATTGRFRIFAQRAGVVDMDVGPDGALYLLTRVGTAIRRVSHRGGGGGPAPPVITEPPEDALSAVDGTATFEAAAEGTPPLSYQWLRDGSPVAGATGPVLTVGPVVAGDDGARFSVRVSNAAGTVTSRAATLTVVEGSAPTATITAPTAAVTYGGGDTIAYAGAGSDPDDGALGPAAHEWEIVFHHTDHTHPFIPPFRNRANGTFIIPAAGETSTIVWYRIHLTVTDSTGLTDHTQVDIQPRIVGLRLDSVPSGLELRLDGQPVRTPVATTSVEGIERTIGAPGAQRGPGGIWTFQDWSDGGQIEHTVAPAVPTGLVARLERPTGYWVAEADGDLRAFGDAPVMDSVSADLAGSTLVAVAAHPSGQGLWALASDGRLLARGAAPALGGVDLTTLTEPGERVTTLSATPDGRGAWVFTTAGRVVALGTALPGSAMAGASAVLDLDLDGPIVDSVATPSGRGAYLVAADGGVFAIGDAVFRGSVRGALDGRLPDRPIVGVTPDPDGDGYWLVGADGGVFAFEAPFRGSVPAILTFDQLAAPINGMVPYGNGYLLVADDGGVFTFSDLPFRGSASGTTDSPVVGMAAIGQTLPPPSRPPDGTNTPPVVDAGEDVGIAAPNRWVRLAGSVSDDGLPYPPGALDVRWIAEIEPPAGSVSFDNERDPTTIASFSGPGNYVLTLSADDSAGEVHDSVLVSVE